MRGRWGWHDCPEAPRPAAQGRRHKMNKIEGRRKPKWHYVGQGGRGQFGTAKVLRPFAPSNHHNNMASTS